MRGFSHIDIIEGTRFTRNDYDRSEAKRVLYENIVYGVTSEPAQPGRHAF